MGVIEIFSRNLTEEQREVLLREYANELLESRRNDLINRNREQSHANRKTFSKRKKSEFINSAKEYLLELKNNQGEKIFTDFDFSDDNPDKLTDNEIEEAYARYKDNQSLEESKEKNSMFSDNKAMLEYERKHNLVQLDKEVLTEKMTTEDMNTILNMYASNNIDKDILEKIANKLGVSPDDLVDIAKKKEEILKEKDALESGENKDDKKEEKTEDADKKSDKDKDEDQSSKDEETKDEETKDEEAEKESGKSMTEPAEGRKKVSFIKQATQKIKDALSKTSTKAFIALASAVVIVSAILANPAFLAIGAAGYGVYQYNKGKKM